MSINEPTENTYNNNYLSNKQKELIYENNNESHFQLFPFYTTKKIFNKKFKYKTEDEKEYFFCDKKTMTIFNQNNEFNSLNNTFTIKKTLIDKDELNKKLNTKNLNQDKLSNSINNLRIFNKQKKLMNETSFNISKCYFPEINIKDNKSLNRDDIYIYPYNNSKNEKSIQHSFDKNSILTSNKTTKRKSISSEDVSLNECPKNKKANYLVLKYNELNNSSQEKIKYKKIEINKVINLINSLLIPNGKTFEILQKLINYNCFINQTSESKKFQIIEQLFKDIIKKICKQMIKKGYETNTLINKNEIKKEYKNEIINLKEYLENIKNNNIKNIINNFNINSLVKDKNINNYTKIKLQKKRKIYNKNKSCNNPFFHFYNFNEASIQINKQNSEKEKYQRNLNNNFFFSIPLDYKHIPKIKFKNTFIKRCFECNNKIAKNKNNENEFNKILNYSEYISKNNNNSIISVKCLLNNNDSIRSKKEQIYSYSTIEHKFIKTKISRACSSNNLIKKKNNYSVDNNSLENKEKNEKNISFLNMSNKTNYFNDNNKNNIIKNNRKNGNNSKRIKEKPYRREINKNIGFLSYNKLKIHNKNKDILNYIKNDNNKINKETISKQRSSSKNDLVNENKINKNAEYKKEYKLSKNEFMELKKKFKEYEIDELYSDKEKHNDDLYSLKEDSEDSSFSKNSKNNSKSNNNNSSNNNSIINKIFTRYKSIDKKFFNTIKSQRKMKKYFSIPRIKNHNNSHFLEKSDSLFESPKEKLDYQTISKELNESLLKFKGNKRQNSISQNYLQLFFKQTLENKNDNMYDKYRKLKFVKRMSKREVNFKQFLKKEKEKEKKEREKENASHVNKIIYEDDKESDWEIRFNVFKQYIDKLKKMSNEEFREDTLKFIKKDNI